MALTVREQMKYWGIVLLIATALLWYLGHVLLPFVVGGAIAYFLDPVADRLETMGLSRVVATAIIAIVALLIFVIMALLLLPSLIQQSMNLFDVAPKLFRDLQLFLSDRFPSLQDETSVVRTALTSIGLTIQERGGALLGTVLSSAASLLGIVSFLVVTPVVAVYLLLDWDNMIAKVNTLIPLDHAPVIRRLAGEIDQTLSAFVRGMGSVCLMLGGYYATALMLVGLDFGLVVGAVAGLITFIPYVGSLVGGALAIGLGLFQFWGDWVSLGLVAGIFFLGQIIEGNYLTPKLVGGSVGLHPVWLLLALSVFGTIFGFIGMLIAVPVAASIGVLARFASAQYLESRLYQGIIGRKPD